MGDSARKSSIDRFRGTCDCNCDHYHRPRCKLFLVVLVFFLLSPSFRRVGFMDELWRSRANFLGAVKLALHEKADRICGWLSQNRRRDKDRGERR